MRNTGGHLAHEHRILLRQSPESAEIRTEEITAATPGLAANAAELRNPGWRAFEVWTQTRIIGRCGRCKTFLVDGQDVCKTRGRLYCGECPP